MRTTLEGALGPPAFWLPQTFGSSLWKRWFGQLPCERGDPAPLQRYSGLFNNHFLSTHNGRCQTLPKDKGNIGNKLTQSRKGDIHKNI